jgi:hypothetical protein
LTDEVLGVLEGRSPSLPSVVNGDFSLDDEHDVATLLGYPIAKFIDDTLDGKSNAVKADLLIRWLDDLAVYVSNKGTAVTLDEMIELLVKKTVSDVSLTNETKTKSCETLKKSIPGLAKSLQACK